MTINKAMVQQFVEAVLFGVLAAGLVLSGALGANALTLVIVLLALIFILRLVGAKLPIIAVVGWVLGFLLIVLVRQLDPTALSPVALMLMMKM